MKSSKFKKKYKAIIFDLDGTLILNKKDAIPSKKVKDAIAKAQKALHVGIATSRPYSILTHIAKFLKLKGPSIISGGSRIINLPSQKILWEQTIDRKTIKNICKIFHKYKLPVFVNDDGNEIEFSRKYAPKKPLTAWTLAVPLSLANSLVKEISRETDMIAHKLPSWISGNITVTCNHSLATKKHALWETARLLKIDTSEIIGVGDGYNDIPLLSSCGLKVAMGNGDDELKKIADYVAPPRRK